MRSRRSGLSPVAVKAQAVERSTRRESVGVSTSALAYQLRGALMLPMKLASQPRAQALGGCLVVQVNGRGVIESVSGGLSAAAVCSCGELPRKGSSAFDFLRACLCMPETSLEPLDLLKSVLELKSQGHRREAFLPGEHGGCWLEITLAPLLVQEAPGAMLCVIDITARKQALESLRGDAERLRAIVDHEPECVKVTDLDGRLLEMNPAGLRIIQADNIEQVRGQLATNLVHPEDRAIFEEFHQQCRAGGTAQGVFRLVGLKGSVRRVETHGVPLRDASGEVFRLLAVTRDITARHEAEELLRQSNKRYEKQRLGLVHLMRSGVLQTADIDQALRDLTEAIAGCMDVARVSVWRFDQTRRSIVCLNLFEALPRRHSAGQELSSTDYPAYFRALEENEMIAAVDACEDPRTREFSASYLRPQGIGALLDAPLHVGGALAGVLCQEHLGGARAWTEDEQSFAISLANLISLVFAQWEHRQVEGQLRQQAELLDLARDAILVRDLDHTITYWNKSAEKLYGWTAEEAVGSKISGLLYREEGHFQEKTDQVLAHGEHICEIRQVTKSGEEVIVEGHWTLVRDHEGRPKSILAINTDVTAKKKIEEQMLRMHRLESIGTLAGGIAHDLNNVLTPILMSIDMLKLRIKDATCQETLQTIAASARRGAEMIRQVLSFARGMEGTHQSVTCHALLHEIAGLVRDTFPKSIRMSLREDPGLWPVHGDATQIHQLLLNLCVNARDAMPEGGELSILAENVRIDATYAATNIEARVGPYVVITVQDEGGGISRENLDKIFDPFFTTKEAGKGTGLGLFSTLGIVKSHGGFIETRSTEGGGARFRVYLPADPSATVEAAESEDADLPRGDQQMVLVVDDEPSVREITRQALETFGYRVMLASHGAEAVALYAQHPGEIDVVLTDMMMPVMDGSSTIQVLRKINPDVRIIAASGVSSHGGMNQVKNCGAPHFLPKPYNTGTLLQVLRQVLAPPPSS